MKKIKYIGLCLASIVMFNACEQEIIELKAPETVLPPPECPADATAGTANFSKYIAVGNSLTAGFQAGALFDEGQQNSMGAMLATQFACVGGGAFVQPDINTENGFFLGAANPLPNGTVLGRLLLQGTPAGPAPTISDAGAIPNPSVNPGFMYGGDRTQLNNFAVPGITMLHMVQPATGDWANSGHPLFNPFYARFASDMGAGTTTILTDAVTALATDGTFFSFFLGSNDVLGYALSGASNPGILTPLEPNPDTGHPGFAALYANELNALLSVPDVKGVAGNIYNFLNIPYFRLVPYNAVPMTQQAVVDQLNAGYATYNGGLDQAVGLGALSAAERDRRKIEFALGANPIVIQDESLTNLSGFGIPSYREATPEDRFVLTASTFIGTEVGGDPTKVNGVSVPLADQWVLVPAEQAEISERIDQFNAVIADVVGDHSDRVALADVNARITELLINGHEVIDGVSVSPSLAPPLGLYSEDGIHPNSRGVAFIANVFIEAINAKFSAKVPLVNLAKFQGTALPVNP